MKDKNIHIALVDDDDISVVQLLKGFLQQQHNINVVITANNGNRFFEQLRKRETRLDLVLLDLGTEDGNGLKTIDILRKHYGYLKIIVVSSYYKVSSIEHMLKLGVRAFLPNEIDKKNLIDVIEGVYNKGPYFMAGQIQALGNQVSHKTPSQYASVKEILSIRELDVLQLIWQQFTTKEISDILFVTTKTIEAHKSNLLLKTGVKSTVGLIIYAAQSLWFDAGEDVVLFGEV